MAAKGVTLNPKLDHKTSAFNADHHGPNLQVLAHSNHMFEDVGFANPRVSTVLIAAGLFVFTIVGAPLIDKLGETISQFLFCFISQNRAVMIFHVQDPKITQL